MATETENKPVVAGEEEKKVEQQAATANAPTTEAAAPAAGDKPAGGETAGAGGDTADKKTEEKPAGENAPAGGEGGDGATSSDATAATAPAKKEKEVKPTVHKVNFEKDVVYLYQFTRTPMLPSISPFCLKVETWLRLAGLKYEVSARRSWIGLGCRHL
uniref:GST N-terminal domain-containing protein n=1 Tax=Anopheles culicifacies TaxID=139723 RepID=A0A182MCY7_9DIPT